MTNNLLLNLPSLIATGWHNNQINKPSSTKPWRNVCNPNGKRSVLHDPEVGVSKSCVQKAILSSGSGQCRQLDNALDEDLYVFSQPTYTLAFGQKAT